MNVWTLRQIDQARGIRAKADVDRNMLDAFSRSSDELADVLAGLHRELFKAMQRIGHSFAIELHPADVQLREGHSERDGTAGPFTIEVCAWWEPKVRVIELRGGWKDGERMEYRDAPSPIRVMTPPQALATFEPADLPMELANIADTYSCVGWHEQERHWIYEPQK